MFSPIQELVSQAGVEPARIAATDLKSVMATNYITGTTN